MLSCCQNDLCAFAALQSSKQTEILSLASMEFLIEELSRIINELVQIRNNLQHEIDLAKMKKICEQRKLALERHRREYEARASNERIIRSVTRDPGDPEDEID